ncbi:MAG: FMN-binding protein [Planctomycetaceae bacterium]|nr:FMN-binding protein [Planctomycetaceae bacterium]
MSNKFVFFLKESWLLMVASVAFGVILAITQSVWGPKIAENQVKLFNQQANTLLPEAKIFEPLKEEIMIPAAKGAPQKAEVIKALDGDKAVGWIFVVEGSGFADKIRLVVAADARFEKILGFNVLAANETPGFGDKIKLKGANSYGAQYAGAPAGEFRLVKVGDKSKIDDEIVAITGATVTSQAVVDMMNAYVGPIKEQLSKKGLLSK